MNIGEVQWPTGYEAVKQMVADEGEGLKAFEIAMGVNKAAVFVVAVDLDNDRLVGVKFPKQS